MFNYVPHAKLCQASALPDPQLHIENVIFRPVAFNASPIRLYRSFPEIPSLKLQLSYFDNEVISALHSTNNITA